METNLHCGEIPMQRPTHCPSLLYGALRLQHPWHCKHLSWMICAACREQYASSLRFWLPWSPLPTCQLCLGWRFRINWRGEEGASLMLLKGMHWMRLYRQRGLMDGAVTGPPETWVLVTN